MPTLSDSTGMLVRIDFSRIVDPTRARRLAHLLFAPSTSTLTPSTGVPS